MDSRRVSATGPWSFVIGPEFELIDNGDSLPTSPTPVTSTTQGPLEEGPTQREAPPVAYASFTRRARALVIDSVVLSGILAVLVIVGDALSDVPGSGRTFVVILFGLFFLYEPVLVWWRGATIGHAMAQLRVVDERSGQNPGALQAFGRYMVKLVLGLFSFVTMALTRRHQAIHDLLTRTTVRVPDVSFAQPIDYHLERTNDPSWRPAPVWRRGVITLGYLALVYFAFVVVVANAVPSACFRAGACPEWRGLVIRAIGLAWVGASAAMIVAGWRGRLYGARSTRIIVDPPTV